MTPFEFLTRLKPDGPIVLVPNGSETPTCFAPGEEHRFNEWLRQNEEKNIYFQLNADQPRRMKQAEIHSGSWLHVDIDSDAAGNSLAFNPEAKAELVERLQTDCTTLIVDTGGGLQAYWELS